MPSGAYGINAQRALWGKMHSGALWKNAQALAGAAAGAAGAGRRGERFSGAHIALISVS